MSHKHPTKIRSTHRFVCDSCGIIAGEDANETEALHLARLVVRMQGWEWFHPGWGLICPGCLKEKKRRTYDFLDVSQG